jgi:hypothetical protein
MILLLIFLLIYTNLVLASPNSVPPVEVTLQKIQVKPAEPYNPAEYEDPIAYPDEATAREAAKKGGIYMFNPVLERHEVLWRKRI